MCDIHLVLVLLPSFLRYVAYVEKQLYLHNLLQSNAFIGLRGTWFTTFKHCIYSNSEMLGKILRKPQFFSLEISGAQSGGIFLLYQAVAP